MNYSTAVFLINDKVRAARGLYDPADDKAKTGLFKTMDQNLRVDDFVIVPTETRHGMTVFKITEIDVDIDFESPVCVKWIIGKVDKTEYDKILGMEADAITAIKSAEKTKKRAELREAMLADAEALKQLPITVLAGPSSALPSTEGQS